MASQLKKLRGMGPLETYGTGEAGIVSTSGIGFKVFGLPSSGAAVYLTTETSITANTTTTTAAAGSLLIGSAGLFRSDGSKWQYIVNS